MWFLKELDYESVWETGWDRCKFVLEQTSDSESSIYLEMHCFQKNSNTYQSKILKVSQGVVSNLH